MADTPTARPRPSLFQDQVGQFATTREKHAEQLAHIAANTERQIDELLEQATRMAADFTRAGATDDAREVLDQALLEAAAIDATVPRPRRPHLRLVSS